MRTYRVDSKTVHIEANDDAESIVLEVVRTGLARSRADRNDPPLINSSYARASELRRRAFYSDKLSRCRRIPAAAASDLPGPAATLAACDELEEPPGPVRMARA